MRKSALRLWASAVAVYGVPLVFVCLCVPSISAAQVGESVASTSLVGVVDVPKDGEKVGNPSATTNFSITPVVANEKAKPRDIIKKELVVTNNTDQRLDVYISVENIDPTQGAQAFVSPAGSDLSTSLANWIEITRGVIELSAGESRKIPYLIHVNLSAKPGSYFARIQFGEGAKRSDAEAKPPEDGTSLMLNVEVLDDAKERLQLGNFTADSSVVTGEQVGFSYLLENVGNRNIEPRGSIRIFNRKGEEVGSVPLNANGEGITPEDKKQLAAAWSATGRFGKYKAFLDLEYGENQLASVQDTVYFWVFPWKEVMFALMGVGLLGVLGTFIVHLRAVARPAPRLVERSVPDSSPSTVYEPLPSHHLPVSSFPVQTSRAHGAPSASGASVVLTPRTRGVVSNVQQASTSRGFETTGTVMPKRAAPTVQGDTISLSRRR